MALTDTDRLRIRLGEQIPAGGTEADTLFSDEEIVDLLTRHYTVEGSLGEGWSTKAAKLAHLVDITEGSSNRRLSQAYKAAMEQAKRYGGGVGHARIHQIDRGRR